MVIVKEYRCVLPFTVEEFQVGQRFAVCRASEEQSKNASEGVQILKNEPFEDPKHGSGQYTHKILNLGSRVPAWARKLCPSKALWLHEHSWNSYPYTKTEYRSEFFDKKFSMVVESIHLPDAGTSDNALNVDEKTLKKRVVDFVKVAEDPLPDPKAYTKDRDPTLFTSEKCDRGPFAQGWESNHSPIMCAYKLVTVHFRIPGIQDRCERYVHKVGMRDLLVPFCRDVICWMDEWLDLTMEDILAMEEESKRKLDKVVSRGEDRQMLKEDNDKIELDSMSETEKLAYMKAALQEKLPQGWEKCFDSKSKRFYYKNHLTKTTQWHSPCPTPAVGSPVVEKRMSKLPKGWEECRTADGKIYYKDHNTKTTHWSPPT